MLAPKRARDDEPAGAATGGAGGPPQPPARRTRATVAAARAPDPAYERRLKLTDVIGFVAQNGYAREASRCAGLCRETWRYIPPWLSASDADRVRRDHPLWQAIINLEHSSWEMTRLCTAANNSRLARVREIQTLLLQQINVLETMSALDFLVRGGGRRGNEERTAFPLHSRSPPFPPTRAVLPRLSLPRLGLSERAVQAH